MTGTATPSSAAAATQAATEHAAESTATAAVTESLTTSPAPSAQATTASGHKAPRTGSVTFRMFAAARAAAGTAEVHVAPGPTAQVVASLAAGLPPRFADVLAASSLLADGVRLDHSSTAAIPAGATVDVLPPFAGG